MAQTLANGVVIPAPGDRISAAGVQEMRTLGASVNTGLALTQAQTAQTDLQSRARDAALADQIAGMEGMTYVGVWEAERVYRINDVVTHGGDSWARLTAGDAGEPGADPAAWGLVARKGDGGGFGELTETDVTGLYATVEPEPSVPVSWADLTGKPATYPSTIPEVDGLQAIIDRLTYDSGWRDVTSLLRPEYTASNPDAYATLRRVGPSVNFNLQQGRNATADGAMAALQVPSGFRVDPAHRAWGSTGIEDNTGLQVTDGAGLYLSGSYVNTHARTGKRYSFSMTWLTSDPIPTSPPGDPA